MTDREDGTVHVVALVGSLRERSFNRGLLRAAVDLTPPGMTLDELPIGTLPFYDEDLDHDDGPEVVRRFRAGIAAADGLLFITPEYNYSISGVLKNAIDWASRPAGRAVILGKPAAVMGAASGRSGTMRAQLHLRQIFVTLNILGLNKPELFVPYAGEKFDQDATLTDETVREQIRQLLAALKDWVERLHQSS